MIKFNEHTGKCAPLFEDNIDTDQIVPKKFLLETGRSGFAKALFYDWRFTPEGETKPGFILNNPKYKDSSILITGSNFGCGSSREHAPWALQEYGFRVIIAPSFADIFHNNCFKIGLLPVVLENDMVERIVKNISQNDDYLLTVKLPQRTITDDRGFSTGFELDAFRMDCLINGLDDIDLTLKNEKKIENYEKNRVSFLSDRGPSLNP